MTSSEAQVASCFAKYEPAVAKLGKTLRAKLRRRLPGLTEVVYVYERQDALVIAYSPTGKGYEAPCSLSVTPGAVKLYFAQGPRLPDPHELLQGGGKSARYVALGSVADYDRPEIEALIAAALKLAKVSPDAQAKGSVIHKAESQKKRALRAEKAARRAPARAPKRVTPRSPPARARAGGR